MGVAAVLDPRTPASGEGGECSVATADGALPRDSQAFRGIGRIVKDIRTGPPCAACSVCVDAGMDVHCIPIYVYC